MTPIRHLSETENISSSYRLLSSSATHRWKEKRERERGENSSKALWKKSHGTLRSSPPLHKGWETKQEKAISHSLPLYTLHPHPSWGKLWRSQARRHLSEWQSEWGSKKKRAWEQTSCSRSCQRTPRHLSASLSCLWIGTRTVINIYNSSSFSTSLPPFAVFSFFFFFFLTRFLQCASCPSSSFFCTLDHSLSVSIIFSF